MTTIQIPGIRHFSNQVEEMTDGINLTIGEPDFPTPENIKQAGIDAIKQNLTGYSHNAGLLELRQKVSSFFKEKYSMHYSPEEEIMITNGASEGLDSVIRTILSDGDEVILPVPCYPAYESLVRLNGGKCVYLDTTNTAFKPDPAKLKTLINNRTKAIILNYPSNPTGVMLEKEEMDAIAKVLQEHELFIISDEIYSENIFNKTHLSFGKYNELRDSLFIVHGLSKSHAMTGWRIGFLLGPALLMEQVLKVHLNNAICASTPSQYAAIEALTKNKDTPSTMNQSYKVRRDYIKERLNKMGVDAILPSGTFYIFPSIEKFEINSYDFATQLLHNQNVAVVPGNSFSEYGEGYIRISYANTMEQLKTGMNRLEAFISEL